MTFVKITENQARELAPFLSWNTFNKQLVEEKYGTDYCFMRIAFDSIATGKGSNLLIVGNNEDLTICNETGATFGASVVGL